jgi:hypothetical protein
MPVNVSLSSADAADTFVRQAAQALVANESLLSVLTPPIRVQARIKRQAGIANRFWPNEQGCKVFSMRCRMRWIRRAWY